MISGFDVDYSGSVASGDRGKVNSIGLAVSAGSGRKTVRGGYDNGGRLPGRSQPGGYDDRIPAAVKPQDCSSMAQPDARAGLSGR